SRLDGIDADVIHDVVGTGYIVQVIDAAVGAEAPDGLILETGGEILAILVVVDLGALDDAAGMAAMPGLAAAGSNGVVHGFAGDLIVSLELADGEILGRQSAGLVEDVDQHVGAVSGQALAADRVVQERLGKGLGSGLEFFGVGDYDLGRSLVIKSDALDLLRAHDRAKAAAAVAAELAVRVLDRDVGGGHLEFAGRADGQDSGLLAEARFHGFNDGKVSLAEQFGLLLDGDAIQGQVNMVPGVLLWLSFDDQRLDPHAGQHLCRGPAGIALLDGAG